MIGNMLCSVRPSLGERLDWEQGREGARFARQTYKSNSGSNRIPKPPQDAFSYAKETTMNEYN